MSNGSDIAAEIAAGILEAGEATGDGPFYCTLRRQSVTGPDTPWSETAEGPPEDFRVTAVQGSRNIRDRFGELTGVVETVLTIAAEGVVPLKSDLIATGISPNEVNASTKFFTISNIDKTAAGGVDLMYDVVLAN